MESYAAIQDFFSEKTGEIPTLDDISELFPIESVDRCDGGVSVGIPERKGVIVFAFLKKTIRIELIFVPHPHGHEYTKRAKEITSFEEFKELQEKLKQFLYHGFKGVPEFKNWETS